MFKKIYVFVACIGFVISIHQNCSAQDKTKEEIKAEREALKAEMQSKDVQDREAKFQSLEAPKNCSIATVDALAVSSAGILLTSKENTKLIPEIYGRAINPTSGDGITDVTVKKPTLDELVKLAGNLALQVTSVTVATQAISAAAEDIKKASPFQAPKGMKSLNFSKEVLALAAPELALNVKVVNNLIATLKSANNN